MDGSDAIFGDFARTMAALTQAGIQDGSRGARVGHAVQIFLELCVPLAEQLLPGENTPEEVSRIVGLIDDRVDLAIYALKQIEERVAAAYAPPPPTSAPTAPTCSKCGCAFQTLLDGVCGACAVKE